MTERDAPRLAKAAHRGSHRSHDALQTCEILLRPA